MSPLRKITAEEFARRLNATACENDKRYAFFLGAGASISSGIPGAASLVKDRWIPRLREFRAPSREFDVWVKEELPDYDPSNPAASYGVVIERLFLQPEERQREIESLCDGRYPGFGYATLAQIVAMDGGHFNVVLTTNFDDMVADALYLFTSARPLVIHHESLANYIRPTRTRPLIVKLHGDHRLSPQNTAQETAKLKKDIEKQVQTILLDRGLIFLGYGGNDTGILRMLKNLPDHALPLGVFWVSGKEPTGVMRPWLESRNAVWVDHGDFDETMLLIRSALALPHPEQKRMESIFRNYETTYEGLTHRIEELTSTSDDVVALKEAVRRADLAFQDSRSVSLAARRLQKQNPDEAEDIFKKGIEQFPDSARLFIEYAEFLSVVRRDSAKAVDYLNKALSIAPRDEWILVRCALLRERMGDNNGAEELYRRSLEIAPSYAFALTQFAHFLLKRQDVDQAERLLQQAMNAGPTLWYVLLDYAEFLTKYRHDYDRAEVLLRTAMDQQPGNSVIIREYAEFLSKVRGNAAAAQELLRPLEETTATVPQSSVKANTRRKNK